MFVVTSCRLHSRICLNGMWMCSPESKMGDHDPQKCNEYGATKTKEFKIKTLACKLIVVVANMSMRGLPTVLKVATSL